MFAPIGVAAATDGNGVKPCFERGFIAVKTPQILKRIDKGFLQHIFGLRVVIGDPHAHIEHRLAVELVELILRLPVAGLAALHQIVYCIASRQFHCVFVYRRWLITNNGCMRREKKLNKVKFGNIAIDYQIDILEIIFKKDIVF